jgi:hypothetical protein
MKILWIFVILTAIGSTMSTMDEEEFLERIIEQDDETRARFGEMKEEKEAKEIVDSIKDIVGQYTGIRRYQRALALVEVGRRGGGEEGE